MNNAKTLNTLSNVSCLVGLYYGYDWATSAPIRNAITGHGTLAVIAFAVAWVSMRAAKNMSTTPKKA